MTYVPTNWVTGDVITAQKLNNMETGISGSAGVLNVEMTLTLDENEQPVLTCETSAEAIANALENGYIITGEVDDQSDNETRFPILIDKTVQTGTEEGIDYCSFSLSFRTLLLPLSTSGSPVTMTSFYFGLNGVYAGELTEPMTCLFDVSNYTLTRTT